MHLTLVSDNLCPICDWEILNNLNSDHLPIITHLNTNNNWKDNDIFIPKWNFNKANWFKFKTECNNININTIKNNNQDIFYDKLIKTINDIADKHIPKTKNQLITDRVHGGMINLKN